VFIPAAVLTLARKFITVLLFKAVFCLSLRILGICFYAFLNKVLTVNFVLVYFK
jgi:hypothetical protein